ncbi:MAG: porin family protein [Segetibacter sp.]|nr:porin family protein [Segetibacter sp.]
MPRNLPDIEELFKTALEDEEEMPEPKVWKAIDNILDKDNVVSIKKKYNDLKKVAFLLFFMLLGLTIYELKKPAIKRNSNSLPKEIVSEKRSGINSTDKNNSIANKLYDSVSSTNNKSKDFPDNLSNLKDRSGNMEQVKESAVLLDDKKQTNDYKRTISNSKLSQQEQIVANNPVATVETKIQEAENVKPVHRKNMTGETSLLKKYSTFYAERLNRVNLDSVNTISLPRFPSLIKIIPDNQDKKVVVENIKTKNSKPSPFSLNLFFSPDFASYRLQDNVPGNSLNEASEIERNERHEFSLTLGASMEYRVRKHWSVQSGLTYSNTNITVAPKTIYAQHDNNGSIKYLLNTSSGYGYVLPSFSSNPTVGDSLYAFTSTHSLQYLSLPVAIKYNITKGKFNFNVMAGTAVNYLIKGKVETSVENGTNNEPEVVDNLQGLKKVYFSGLADVGMDYLINTKIAITFAPTFRFAVNSINKDASVKSYPNSIGLATGLRFNF